MTKTPEQCIRIYKKDPDGNLHDAREDFWVYPGLPKTFS